MEFPPNFCNIGEKSFSWVYENKDEFVKHTLNDMKKPTGLFKQWFEYCKMRMKKRSENNKEK